MSQSGDQETPFALSLVIPCYNEADNLIALFERCGTLLARGDVEILFVDNGSTDDTATIMADHFPSVATARAVRVDVNQGYGFGILSGLQQASGQFLAWTHADLQTDPADALKALACAEGAADPAKAFVKGRRHGRPIRDVAFTWGMAAFELFVLGEGLWDINAQPTLFHRSFFDGWHEPPHDFSLDLFAYIEAKKAGLEVLRFPVVFERREAGFGHHESLAGKLRLARRTIRYSIELRRRLSRNGG